MNKTQTDVKQVNLEHFIVWGGKERVKEKWGYVKKI